MAKNLLLSEQSLNFDLVIKDASLTFSKLKSLRVKAFMMKLEIVKIIIDWSFTEKNRQEFIEI